MSRIHRAFLALAVIGVFMAGTLAVAQTKPAGTPAAPATTAQQPTKWVNPIRGTADIQIIAPKVVVKGNEVITTIQVKNTCGQPIAGLQVEQYWWDKAGNPVPGGDRQRLKKILMPGEVITITLTSEKDKTMNRDNYQFSHANGQIKVKTVKKFE
jgi:hypothetical protein